MNDEREKEQTPDTDSKGRAEQGRKNRDEMDETPPHGTDSLHEGP